MVTHDIEVQRRMNDGLAKLAAAHPGRVGGFCTVDPFALDAAAKEVERCVRTMGMIGVKLHPWLQAFSVTHPGVALILSAAADLKVPVLFHDGTPPYSTPAQIAWLAERHPETQVIFGHAGLGDFWRDACDAGRRLPNVWLQPTAAPPLTIRSALDAVGPDRILFGSDAGFCPRNTIEYCMSKYRRALGNDLLLRVLQENPQRLR